MTRRQEATEARWRHGLAQLRAYTEIHGAATPHTRLVVHGFPLGRWAAKQRERYWAQSLPLEQVAALTSVPGWEWGRTNTDRWAEGLGHLHSYLREHGTTAVDTLSIHEGFDLGGGWDGGAATTTTAPCRLPGSPPCRPSRGGCGPSPKTHGRKG